MNKHLNLTTEVGNCSSRNQIWRLCQVSRECLGTQGTAVALPGPGHYEQDDGMEFTCGFGIWLEQLEHFQLNLEKWKNWRCEKGCKDDWWKSWRGKKDQRALGPVLGEIHGCPETKSSKGLSWYLDSTRAPPRRFVVTVVTVASFEVCASAFKDGPKRTDWAPEDCCLF